MNPLSLSLESHHARIPEHLKKFKSNSKAEHTNLISIVRLFLSTTLAVLACFSNFIFGTCFSVTFPLLQIPVIS